MLLPSSPLLLKLLLSGAWTWCQSMDHILCCLIDVHIWGESLNTLLTGGVLQRLTPVAGDLLCKWILKHSSQYRSGNKRHINMSLVNNVLSSPGLSYLLYKMGAVVVPPSCWGRLCETSELKVLAVQSAQDCAPGDTGARVCLLCRNSEFVRCFFCIHWDDLFFTWLCLCAVTLISFSILSHPCIPEISLTWS